MLNLEPIEQQLTVLRFGDYSQHSGGRVVLTTQNICDTISDLLKEVKELRLDNDRLRAEKLTVNTTGV